MTRFPRRAALLLIRFYQIALSPFLGSQCRFSPTCSHFAMGAINKYGVFRGGWYAARRISKCHPWADGGYDPVP